MHTQRHPTKTVVVGVVGVVVVLLAAVAVAVAQDIQNITKLELVGPTSTKFNGSS